MTCPRCGAPAADGHVCASLLAHTLPMPKAVSRAASEPATEPAGEAAAPDAKTRLAMDPTLPDVIEGYRLGYVIGTGGGSTVYQAERAGQRVAVKVARRGNDDPRLLDRALAEARAAALVAHPNVVAAKSAGVLPDGRPYLITELLEGEPLDAVLSASGALRWPLAVAVLDDVAAALEAAHAHGVVHRDVKPGNVFLARGGGETRARLIDFGLALLGAPGEAVPQTDAAAVPGTPEYSSPEQARGEALDAGSDLYALGVVAFELLAGTLPFAAPSSTGVLRLHAGAAAPPLGEVAEVPPALGRLVDALLAKRPDRRPGSAGEVRAALSSLAVFPVPRFGLASELLASWLEREGKKTPVWRRLLGALS